MTSETHKQLLAVGTPCYYLVEMDESSFQNLYLRLILGKREHIIRMIRGKKSRAVPGFFDESSAALQFPSYFGENWGAFDECITDLEWLEGDAYVLMVSSAHLLLCDAQEEDSRILLRILENANDAGNN